MTENLCKAEHIFAQGEFTFVAVCGGETVTSKQKGVAPVLSALDEGRSLVGFSAADKIVGRAAAFLFVQAGIVEVYAETISRGGLALLALYGIPCRYGTLTDVIVNRQGSGICPMEQAVAGEERPTKAVAAIRARVAQLKGN